MSNFLVYVTLSIVTAGYTMNLMGHVTNKLSPIID